LLEKSSDLDPMDHGIPVADLGAMTYGGASGRFGRIGRTGNDPGPHAVTSSGQGGTIEYDANGNMTRFGDLQMTWDFVDRLWAVEDSESRMECAYDYSDTRTIKKVFQKSSTGVVDETDPD